MAEYQHRQHSIGFMLSDFHRSTPSARKPDARELLSLKRAKSLTHWVLGWVYSWQRREAHGPGMPIYESLSRNVTRNNALLAYLMEKPKGS